MVKNASHLYNGTYSQLLEKKYDQLEPTESSSSYAKSAGAGGRVVEICDLRSCTL